MTTDWKALCAELVAWAEKTSSNYYKQADVLLRARAALAEQPVGEGPPAVTTGAWLHPAYEPGDGSADGAQMVELAWWHPQFGCDSLQMVVDNARAVLAHWGNPALQPPAEGEGPSESDLADLFYRHVGEGSEVGFENAIAEALARWGNHQVSLTSSTQPLPEGNHPAKPDGSPADGEMRELVAWLKENAEDERQMSNGDNPASLNLDRAADLLQRLSPPQPVPVSERLPGPEDCDVEGRCWLWERDCGYSGCKWALVDRTWSLSQSDEDLSVYTHWLPFHALPLPKQEVSE